MHKSGEVVAVIADIVDSRRSADRSAVQRGVENTVNGLPQDDRTIAPFRPTVGDEFQAIFADVPAALRATLLVILALPEGVHLRFGLGAGDVRPVLSRHESDMQDGSAWWNAREAITTARGHEKNKLPTLRSWFIDGSSSERIASLSENAVNAYLSSRDDSLFHLSQRHRRMAHLLARGAAQAEVAAAENVTPSAVSQALRRSGLSALLMGLTLFEAPSS